jgi:hypothetical protein
VGRAICDHSKDKARGFSPHRSSRTEARAFMEHK